MRAAIVATVILTSNPAWAGCHRFSIWHYPWRQTCRVTPIIPVAFEAPLPEPRPIEIPIPSLTDIDWGSPPDDDTRGRLMLRTTLQPKDDQ